MYLHYEILKCDGITEKGIEGSTEVTVEIVNSVAPLVNRFKLSWALLEQRLFHFFLSELIFTPNILIFLISDTRRYLHQPSSMTK